MKLSRIDIIGQNGNDGIHYNTVYVVVMTSTDSYQDYYILGAYSTLSEAKVAGEVEESWRKGYRARAEQLILDEPIPDEKQANHYAIIMEKKSATTNPK